jgi:DNA-binding NtrC family response regulator
MAVTTFRRANHRCRERSTHAADAGHRLAWEIGRIRASLPVILTTGFMAHLTEEHARQFGIRVLLPKPPTVESLAEIVHRVLSTAK